MAIFSTFNPSTMPAEVVESTLVQREPLVERLVDVFEESAKRTTKHNVLLVGPRGIGKSHMLSVVYHRLKADKTLTNKLSIAYLREDEWGINSFLDLLVRTSDALFAELGTTAPFSLGDLSALSIDQAESRVWSCVEATLEGKTLLLIVENLDAIFEKIGEQGQRKWRALLQSKPQWAILATTPALSSAISRHVAPFYGFFEVIHLRPLTFEEAVVLLQRLARWNDDEPTATFLNTAIGRARVRAVQHLAGGNHRIFVLFYDFLSQSGSAHFLTPLVKTVDALTPYYQSQMARLSPQQQKITDFLCKHQSPATVTAIAKNCLISHQTAASQLRQLLKRRYVRVNRIGRESFYELAEPLLRICVEAKTHNDHPFELLVDFIRYWFSREELESKLAQMKEHEPERAYFMAAMKEYDTQHTHTHLSPEIASLCSSLHLKRGTSQQLEAQAQELAELSRIAEDWYHFARGMAWLDKEAAGIRTLKGVLKKEPDNVEILRSLALLEAKSGSGARAKKLLERAIALRPNQGILFFQMGRLLGQLNQSDKAVEAFNQAVVLTPDLHPLAVQEEARILGRAGRYEAAREVLSPFLSKGRSIPGIFIHYGFTFAGEDKFEEALKYYDKAVAAFPGDAIAWANKGIAMCKLGMYKAALEPFDRAAALSPSAGRDTLHYRCEALFETRQYGPAVESIAPEHIAHNIFHQLLKVLNSRPNQEDLQQELLRLKGIHESAVWQNSFLGALTELASYAADFEDAEDLKELGNWNSAIQELFRGQPRFSILVKLFDVLTRVKVSKEKRALLELPREQRLLLLGQKKEEEFLTSEEDERSEPLT